MSANPLSFDETPPAVVKVRLGAADYTLQEPNAGDYAKLCHSLLRAIRVAPDGRPAGADIDYIGDAVARELRGAAGASVPRATINRWPFRIVCRLFIRIMELAGEQRPPLTTGALYRWCLAYWAGAFGSEFPALAAKIRKVLHDPANTEAEYADAICDVNRSGGPYIGTPLEMSPHAHLQRRAEEDLPDPKRRRCYDRDHTWRRWKEEGMGDAAIRDRWNRENPKQRISKGESGRDLVKKRIGTAKKELLGE